MKNDTQLIPLKDALKEKLTHTSLSEDQLQHLRQLEQAHSKTRTESSDISRPLTTPIPVKWFVAFAAVFLLGLFIVSYERLWIMPEQQLFASITKEIRTNHLYDKPMDYVSGSAKELFAQFDRLDFQPLMSSMVDSSWTLLGARYCTLQGQIALLVKLQDPFGNRMTYYLTKETSIFSNIPKIVEPYIDTHSGLSVKLWKQEGLIAATVHQVDL